MNKKTIDYEKENMIIEEMAQAIKFSGMSVYEREKLENEIIKHILLVKGLGYYNELGEDSLGHTLEESRYDNGYSGLIYFKTYKDVMNGYGMKDAETGEMIPFMKLFNNLINLRKNAIVKEKIEERDYFNSKAKEERMNDLVRRNVKRLDSNNRFNVMNIDKVIRALKNQNCDAEIMEKAKYIMENNIVCTDYVVTKEDPENGSWLSDNTSVDRYEDSDNAINQLTDGIDRAIENARSKTLKMYIRYYTNLKLINYVPTAGTTFGTRVEAYVDKNLQSYIENAAIDDEVQVLANYLNLERETVRKNLHKAKMAIAMAA